MSWLVLVVVIHCSRRGAEKYRYFGGTRFSARSVVRSIQRRRVPLLRGYEAFGEVGGVFDQRRKVLVESQTTVPAAAAVECVFDY